MPLVSKEWVRTKIVCTIGPQTQSVDMLKKLYGAGMRCARMNFSHGSHEYHAQTIANVRSAMSETKGICAIMLDTKGPEIRSGKLEAGEAKVEQGTEFTLKYFPDDPQGVQNKGNSNWVAHDYANLHNVLEVGKEICIDDGLLSLTVLRIEGTDVVCKVNNTVNLGETKGINLPNTPVDLPAITEKDKSDLIFGVQQGVDLIAASFVRKADDVRDIRKVLGLPGRNIMIFSKIESQEGLDNFDGRITDEILAVSDGIMVARGDLGIEIPIQKVYLAQKMIIDKCNHAGKPVITATQMLESMIVNPRPTRAEVTDVANAVVQGTDCVMLSGETAKGKRFTEVTGKQEYLRMRTCTLEHPQFKDRPNAVQAAILMTLSHTGATARAVAKYKPSMPCFTITPSEQVQLEELCGGV
eukprot:759103-Hanusia_phi.AAC.1